MSAHTPRTAAAVRLSLLAAARAAQAEGKTISEQERWHVIKCMEDPWRDVPFKQRAANRRGVTQWLFGFSSTTLLSDAHMIALAAWVDDLDAWDELRLCLRAALVEAGQDELELPE